MDAIAKYANLEVMECYTNGDEISNPWYDSVLIAKKPYSIKDNSLNKRMDNLEKKLDLILKEINK